MDSTLCGCCLTEKTVTSWKTAFAGRAVAELSVRPTRRCRQPVKQANMSDSITRDGPSVAIRSSPHSASRISPLDILACIPFNTGADRPAPGSGSEHRRREDATRGLRHIGTGVLRVLIRDRHAGTHRSLASVPATALTAVRPVPHHLHPRSRPERSQRETGDTDKQDDDNNDGRRKAEQTTERTVPARPLPVLPWMRRPL